MKIERQHTVGFFATLGVNSGYNHNNVVCNSASDAEAIAVSIRQEVCDEMYFTEKRNYISGPVNAVKIAYSKNWGCPEGGEQAVALQGQCNTNFTDIESYKEDVIEMVKRCALKLKQTTTQIFFSDGEMIYLSELDKE